MIENVKSYNNFADFRKRVLDPAQTEINELTDLTVDFTPILEGRKTIKVKFNLVKKKTNCYIVNIENRLSDI